MKMFFSIRALCCLGLGSLLLTFSTSSEPASNRALAQTESSFSVRADCTSVPPGENPAFRDEASSTVVLPEQLSTIAPLNAANTNLVSIIDLMVVYTSAAKNGAGGSNAMAALIDIAVAEANTVYQNSRVAARLRLIALQEVNYNEYPSVQTNLDRLRLRTDGFMDEVHGSRTTNQADLVTLITEHEDPTVAGKATSPVGAASAATSDFAFSVVARSALVGGYVFVHEISHNFGAQHDRENAIDTTTGQVKPGSFPFSYGYRFFAGTNTYRDVMSYEPGTVIPFLSNPELQYLGAAIGLPGTTNGANNAQTVTSNATAISAYVGTAVKTSPPSVSFTNPASGTIFPAPTNIALSVNASDPGGAIRSVKFYSANLLLGTVTNPVSGQSNRFSFTWTNTAPGPYQITAVAADNVGASSSALPIDLTVRPLNDNFAARTALSGASPSATGSTRSATAEVNEPDHANISGLGSVWYSWVSPKSGTVIVTATGQGMFPVLGVYKGTSSLTNQVRAFDLTNEVCHATLDVIGGQTFAIAVDAATAGGTGDFSLSLQYVPPPVNDDFANRLQLAGAAVTFSATNDAATRESGELLHSGNVGGKSVWYTWQAPRSNALIVIVAATNFVPLIDVYAGTALSNLVAVPGRTITFDSNRVTTLTFNTASNQTYFFAVDGFQGGSGLFTFNLAYPGPPANDNFANRTLIAGSSISLLATNRYATREPSEPQHTPPNPGGASIWYAWVAPVSGPVTLRTQGTGFFPLVDVYNAQNIPGNSGGQFSSLITETTKSWQFDSNQVDTLRFTATAQRSYAIALDGLNGLLGPISFSLITSNTPPTIRSGSRSAGAGSLFSLGLNSSPGVNFAIQASTNLLSWTEVFRGSFAGTNFSYADTNSALYSFRFYRLQALP